MPVDVSLPGPSGRSHADHRGTGGFRAASAPSRPARIDLFRRARRALCLVGRCAAKTTAISRGSTNGLINIDGGRPASSIATRKKAAAELRASAWADASAIYSLYPRSFRRGRTCVFFSRGSTASARVLPPPRRRTPGPHPPRPLRDRRADALSGGKYKKLPWPRPPCIGRRCSFSTSLPTAVDPVSRREPLGNLL